MSYKKPKVALFKFTCCAGCEFEFLYFQDHLLETLGVLDIVYFKMGIRRDRHEGPFDVAIIDGAVSSPDQVKELKWIRKNSEILVALGSCAVDAGILSIKNWTTESVIEERVYPDTSVIHSIKVHPIDEYVKVDAYLKGCPVNEKKMLDLFKSILLGKRAYTRPHVVCVECKKNENECLMVTKGEMCMGPVTEAGCGAICLTNKRACYGCRGPMSNPNVDSMARTFATNALTREDIFRKFTLFSGLMKEFRKVAELHE